MNEIAVQATHDDVRRDVAGLIGQMEKLHPDDWVQIEKCIQASISDSRKNRWSYVRLGRMLAAVIETDDPGLVIWLLSYADNLPRLSEQYAVSQTMSAQLGRLAIYADYLDDMLAMYARSEFDWTDLSVSVWKRGVGQDLIRISALLLKGTSIEMETTVQGYFNLLSALAADGVDVVSASRASDRDYLHKVLDRAEESLAQVRAGIASGEESKPASAEQES